MTIAIVVLVITNIVAVSVALYFRNEAQVSRNDAQQSRNEATQAFIIAEDFATQADAKIAVARRNGYAHGLYEARIAVDSCERWNATEVLTMLIGDETD